LNISQIKPLTVVLEVDVVVEECVIRTVVELDEISELFPEVFCCSRVTFEIFSLSIEEALVWSVLGPAR
jgi:hypothetical protein